MPGHYTNGERISLGWNLLRGAKQSLAGGPDSGTDTVDPKIVRRVDRIRRRGEDRAEAKAEREMLADRRAVDKAQATADDAKVAERLARGSDKPKARQARREAERDLRRVERRTHYR